ncbi:MAG: hypothetical protein P1V97_25820 [Planctomycetota bacterium]|nr:hypothetical protein [Planctomycetota bacterium]
MSDLRRRKSAKALIYLAIGAMTLANTACTYSRVQVDRLPSARVRLMKGESSYSKVLANFGPPHDIVKTGDGFCFRYDQLDAKEYKVTIDYRRARLSNSIGDLKHRRFVVFFNHAGRYLRSNVQTIIRDTGWGGIIGHTGMDSPFFNARNYKFERRDQRRWGGFFLDRESDYFVKDPQDAR